MRIRPAVSADAASIASIVNALLLSSTIEWKYEHYSDEAMLEWMEVHDCVLVAEDQQNILGMAAFGPFRDAIKWPGYRFTVENTVHVGEQHWRSGVGRRLMESLVQTARDPGRHAMVAAVDALNEESIRFHERLGLREVARMPEVGAKFGRWLDLVLLELRLDDRTSPGQD